MKILVSVKRAIDYNVRIQVAPDGSGVVKNGVKHSMNPFDEIAVEQAIRWKEDGTASEVVAVAIGDDAVAEQLRTALAFGCDRAIHVKTDDEIQPLTAARVFKALAERESPDLFLMGKQAIDDDANQTGQMTAAKLNWPQATFASKIELADGTAEVTREIDTGLETLSVDLPAVVTVDLRLNEPRYLKLPNIMKAKKKPIEALAFDELDVAAATPIETVTTKAPPKRAGGIMVETVDELVAKLKEKSLI